MTQHPEPHPADDDITAAQAELAAALAEVRDPDAVVGNELVPVDAAGRAQAVAAKAQLAARYKVVAKARARVVAANDQVRTAVERKQREMEAVIAAARAQADEMKAELARMEDGIRAFNLYLGRDEEIVVITEGESAPPDTPIVVRQQVLFMDEEAALLADQDSLDFTNLDLFVEWLREDRARVEALLPEAKGVVALRPRRRTDKETSAGRGYMHADENMHSAWLIRNGERAWLTFTDAFKVGDRVVPARDEFTALFLDGRGGQLVPGSAEWERAERIADVTKRHYMKVGLVLEGLLHRTKVFHPLPSGEVSFLDDSAYDAGTVRIVADAENVLAATRAPFRTWLKTRTRQLRPGMRVVGHFHGWSLGFRAYDDAKNYEHANVRPQGVVPADGVYVVKATDRRYFDFQFAFDRPDQVWDPETGDRRPAKRKATCYFSAGDQFVIPIDTVTVEELREYLGARSERHEYRVMFPLLKAALQVKLAEEAAEAPFRSALAAKLAATAGYEDLDDLDTQAGELITWYKTATKWNRTLDPADAKASRVILAEARRRQADELATLSMLQDVAPGAMVYARRSRDYVALVPHERAFPTAAVSPNLFAELIIIAPDGTIAERRPWQLLRRAQTSRWTVLEHDDRWTGWIFDAPRRHHLTDDEINDLIQRAQTAERDVRPFLIAYGEYGFDGSRESVKRDALRVTVFGVDVDGAPVKFHGRVDDDEFEWDHWVRPSYQAETGEKAWRTSYWGELPADATIWTDAALAAEVDRRQEAIAAEREADRALSTRAWALMHPHLERQWEAAWIEGQRSAYIADFGDDELFDEHLKTLRRPRYPHDRYITMGGALHTAIRQMLRAGTDPAGRTVGAVLEETGTDTAGFGADLLASRLGQPTTEDASDRSQR